MDLLQVKYPIYIISKGRWDNPITAKIFLKNKIDFIIAVEEQEYNNYKTTIPEKFIRILPFKNLGLGSFPARNWCWEDSIQRGFKKHHLFDDNIYSFGRLNNGKKTLNYDPIEALKTLEEFTDRYRNVAISGFNYCGFAQKQTPKPFTLNAHVYSAMLINNHIPFRWRLKYNEDIDLCLQALHNKWCTILLNIFVVDKVSTSKKLKGGNQTELYKNNNPKLKALKARSIQKVWPQYVKVVYRFGRPHHQISWTKHFKQKLIKCSN